MVNYMLYFECSVNYIYDIKISINKIVKMVNYKSKKCILYIL